MSKYAIFAGPAYYPDAGWLGHYATVDTVHEAEELALEIADRHRFDWWQVADLSAGEIVRSMGEAYESMDSMVYAKRREEK